MAAPGPFAETHGLTPEEGEGVNCLEINWRKEQQRMETTYDPSMEAPTT